MCHLNEPTIWIFFFTVQFYQTYRIPDKTKKILGPKINPQIFKP